MEETDDNTLSKINVFTTLELVTENITVLDLSNKNINAIDANIVLPENLTELYLKHNKLTEVPVAVLNLKKIKLLDISFNEIEFFDDTPNFYESIEQLNISNNKLAGPPYWIWTTNCTSLMHINLSFNKNLTNSFCNGYFEELLKYNTLVTNIIINNCRLINHLELLSTFPKAKVLVIGNPKLSNTCFTNKIEEVPFSGLDKCCDIEILDLSNTNIYNVISNINIYKNLKEINLSLNKISSLPEEFCCLVNLEKCILSYNNLLYLPENFNKLEKLRSLFVNGNSLCMLPEHLCRLPYLNILDLYDNNLNEAPEDIEKLVEIDLAQNYFDEPENEEYVRKKEKIRSNNSERYDGRKVEKIQPESEYSNDEIEELLSTSRSEKSDTQEIENRPISSPEDWDSDDYWIPHFFPQSSAPAIETWNHFVKQKMAEGNFCPMDAHTVSVADRVKYEKLCYPTEEYESEGQFDDYSGDDS
ncbi:unnamed protein product [Euphydryas editha]|uniref:Uncharacterized protein n=1 Tax=Euphydryas editha TaxID=104508 RepID=A0AAU9VAD2_EUPED|nr:unnamed protein product [Euphydryas editha]